MGSVGLEGGEGGRGVGGKGKGEKGGGGEWVWARYRVMVWVLVVHAVNQQRSFVA